MGLFVNVWDYYDPEYPFQLFQGSRGDGKTYSALKGCIEQYDNTGKRMIYTKRMVSDLDRIVRSADGSDNYNPFKQLNEDIGRDVHFKRHGKQDVNILENGNPMGYGSSIKSLARAAGIDASDCVTWVHDEFIKKPEEMRINGELNVIMGGYESFNRNREFVKNEPPLSLFMLSNANEIYNDIYIGLGIVDIVEKMVISGTADHYIKDRGLAIHLIKNSAEFEEKKKNTALARLMEGTDFYGMAFNNEFAYNDFSLVKKCNKAEYMPKCQYGKACIYRHKSRNAYYVSYGSIPWNYYNPKTVNDTLKFQQQYCRLYNNFRNGTILFESYELKAIIMDLIL